jgi:dimeric dUTPase (all-alpha-NTP-PPase superfamily)
MLNDIFEHQRALQERFTAPIHSGDNAGCKQEYTNVMLLALFDEIAEVMRETAWKNPELIPFGWKKGQAFDRDKYVKELADVLHFFVNLCLVRDITAREIHNAYLGKNRENHKRKDHGY